MKAVTHFFSLFLTAKHVKFKLKMWLNLHENWAFLSFADRNAPRSQVIKGIQILAQQKFVNPVLCRCNDSNMVMTMLWLHTNTMNMLLAPATPPVKFTGTPEEERFRTDAPAVHTHSLRKQDILELDLLLQIASVNWNKCLSVSVSE